MSLREEAGFAVLLKTHFWDDFVRRRLDALLARCRTGEVWVVVDETHGAVPDIDYPQIFRSRESDFVRMGLPAEPAGKLNWYNADYQLLAFREAHPDFAFYLMVEYDAEIHQDIDALAARAIGDGIDLLSYPNPHPLNEWGWRHTIEDIWPLERVQHHLLCISGFSNAALRCLLKTRLDHARRHEAGDFTHWPYCEALIPTAIKEAGLKLANLDGFGSTSAYRWWPPYHESELGALEASAFVHPILTGDRYVNSALRYTDLETWLTPDSPLRRRLDREDPRLVLPQLISALVAQKNIAALIGVQQIMRDEGWAGFDTTPALRKLASQASSTNLAARKFAYQSSTSPYSHHAEADQDAAGAVTGKISGRYGFHTGKDIQPWWMVDLGAPHLVSEIRIHNRGDAEQARARNLSVWLSPDGRHWARAFRRSAEEPFGTDGEPLVISIPESEIARFIRIEQDGRNYLHLDAVEVWGIGFGP